MSSLVALRPSSDAASSHTVSLAGCGACRTGGAIATHPSCAQPAASHTPRHTPDPRRTSAARPPSGGVTRQAPLASRALRAEGPCCVANIRRVCRARLAPPLSPRRGNYSRPGPGNPIVYRRQFLPRIRPYTRLMCEATVAAPRRRLSGAPVTDARSPPPIGPKVHPWYSMGGASVGSLRLLQIHQVAGLVITCPPGGNRKEAIAYGCYSWRLVALAATRRERP